MKTGGIKKRNPQEIDHLKKQALKLRQRNKFGESLELYRRVLQERDSDLESLLGGAQCLEHLNRFSEAIEFFCRAVAGYSLNGYLLKALWLTKRIQNLNPSETTELKKLAVQFAKKTGRAAQLCTNPKVSSLQSNKR